MSINDMVAFVQRQLDVVEQTARQATPGPWVPAGLYKRTPGCRCLSCYEDEPWAWEIDQIDGPDSGNCIHPMHIGAGDAAHIARHDPQAVLADVAAKRAILARHCLYDDATLISMYGPLCRWCSYPNVSIYQEWPCPDVRALASAHRHREGWREEWSA